MARAGFITLALGVVVIGVLIVFVISLVQGHLADSWLLGFNHFGDSIVRVSTPLHGAISLCSVVAVIISAMR